MDWTTYVAKTKAQLVCSWSAPLVWHMQKAGFLMTWLRWKCHTQQKVNLQTLSGERGGLVVNASDPRSRGPGFEPHSGQTMLCPWARHIHSPKVLVIPRKWWLRPNMTEKLFTGTLKIKSTNQKHCQSLCLDPQCLPSNVYKLTSDNEFLARMFYCLEAGKIFYIQ